MEIKVIASSSSGNCYFVSDGITNLLIEAGVNLNRIRKYVNLSSLSGCLISHEHLDHSKYAKEIAKYCNIYSSKGTLEALGSFGNFEFRKQAINGLIKIGTFYIKTFETVHDAIDPVGFLILSSHLKETLFFATDTKVIKNKFENLDYIMIEANYSLNIADNNLTALERRRYNTHLSLEGVVAFLKTLDLTKTKKMYLMHLSDSASDEKYFKETVQKLTGKEVIICKK